MQAVRGLRFTGVAGSLILLATGYCLAHGLVMNDELNLPRTLGWAVASTLPWEPLAGWSYPAIQPLGRTLIGLWLWSAAHEEAPLPIRL